MERGWEDRGRSVNAMEGRWGCAAVQKGLVTEKISIEGAKKHSSKAGKQCRLMMGRVR